MTPKRQPTPFEMSVYNACSLVPKGKVTTYGAIAKKLKIKAYRAVGQALNKNPFAPKVPCHRVVSSSGHIGGFASGCENKIKLLAKEGVKVKDNKISNFKKFLYKF